MRFQFEVELNEVMDGEMLRSLLSLVASLCTAGPVVVDDEGGQLIPALVPGDGELPGAGSKAQRELVARYRRYLRCWAGRELEPSSMEAFLSRPSANGRTRRRNAALLRQAYGPLMPIPSVPLRQEGNVVFLDPPKRRLGRGPAGSVSGPVIRFPYPGVDDDDAR